jgi:hypothetical protein
LLTESLTASAGPQNTSVAGQVSGLQPAASDLSNAVTAPQTVPPLDSAEQPILQTGNSQARTDVLGGLGQDEVLGDLLS